MICRISSWIQKYKLQRTNRNELCTCSAHHSPSKFQDLGQIPLKNRGVWKQVVKDVCIIKNIPLPNQPTHFKELPPSFCHMPIWALFSGPIHIDMIFLFRRQGSGGIISYAPAITKSRPEDNDEWKCSAILLQEFKTFTVHGLGLGCNTLEDLTSNQSWTNRIN